MIEQVKTNLQQVLDNVIQNSAQLKQQVEQQKAQIAAGEDQLAKFNTLIASLQVALNTPSVLEAATIQEAANAILSPTIAGAAANEAAPVDGPQEAIAADLGPQVATG